jgi:hypothetical protein
MKTINIRLMLWMALGAVTSGFCPAQASVVFTIDPSHTNLPSGYSYCLYPQGFSLTASSANQYTIAAGQPTTTSCQPINSVTPFTTITGSISDIPNGARLYVVAIDAGHTVAEVKNPAGSAFGTPLPGQGAGTNGYNPPFVALEMTGGTSLDIDLSSIDWFGVPANISVLNSTRGPLYCTQNGVGANTPYSTNGVCNQVGNPLAVAMSDIIKQVPTELQGLIFNMDAKGANGLYQSIMGLQDYTAQKTSDSYNYLNMGSSTRYPLQYSMDKVVAGLFSSTNKKTYYLQGAASAAGHNPTINADIYQCIYSDTSASLYPAPNNISVTPDATISSYIQCTNIGTNVPGGNAAGTEVFKIYDPRQIAYLTYNENDIRGTWTATNPCNPSCSSADQTTTWTFTITGTSQLPIAVPNGGGWQVRAGNWISGAFGTYSISQISTDATNTYISSVSIPPQKCNSPANPKGYVCPQPPTDPMGMGFYQADPIKLAFGPSITRSIFAGVGAAIDNAYQYPTNSGSADVLGSLEDQFNEAMNRGLFDSNGSLPEGCEPTYDSTKPQAVTTACFDNNDYWYNASFSPNSLNPSGISNPYAAFLHTGKTSEGSQFFIPQTLYGKTADSLNGDVGKTSLGLVYTFQMDESPIPATLNYNGPSSKTGPYLFQPYAVNGQWSALPDGTQITVALTPWVPSTPGAFSISGSIYGLKIGSQVTVTAQEGTNPPVTNNGTSQYLLDNLAAGTYALKLTAVPNGYACVFETSGTTSMEVTVGPSSTQNINCIKSAGYHVGGTVTGLDSNRSVTIFNNSLDTLIIQNPSVDYPDFEFAHRVAPTSGYSVAVKSQPSGQTCTVTANGSGTAKNHQGARQVQVTCSDNPLAYTVGGSVMGLAQGESLNLTLNGRSQIAPIAGSGSGSSSIPFTLAPELVQGQNFAVAVSSQGSPPGKVCTVSNGTGVISQQNVTSVSVQCADNPATYSLRGNVSGLQSGDSLVISDKGEKVVVAWPKSTYAFDDLETGTPYVLSILSSSKNCTFSGPGASAGVIAGQDIEVDVSCVPTAGLALSVQNKGLGSVFLLNKNQAGVLELNGGLTTVVVWGGSQSPTPVGAYASGFSYNVQIVGQSKNQDCNYSYLPPGKLAASTVLPFSCGNAPGVVPGVCNGTYANQVVNSLPETSSLCDQGYSSGPILTSDGRYRWRCSGVGNPQVSTLGGTQTCYSLSRSEPAKQNQSPLAIAPSRWTITAGGSQTFSVFGGSGRGAVYVPKIENVGHANCSITTRLNNPGWRITAKATPGTGGSGACVVWVSKAGDTNYSSVDASPAVFNVKPQ